MNRRILVALVTAASIGAACGKNPVAPTTSIPPEPLALLGPAGPLSIASFSISGWHDEVFHYLPALRVQADRTGGDLFVRQIEFKAAGRALAGVRPGNPWRVPAGGSFDLAAKMTRVEMTSAAPLASIEVDVTVADEAGLTATVTGEATVPSISQDAAAARLAIRDFTVTGSYDPTRRRFYYWPKLTLGETSGVSPASIMKITFELLDVGPAGHIPPITGTFTVPAGGTLSLIVDDYFGEPFFELDSEADASRVSVVISFVDRDGRGSSVSAIAEVSR